MGFFLGGGRDGKSEKSQIITMKEPTQTCLDNLNEFKSFNGLQKRAWKISNPLATFFSRKSDMAVDVRKKSALTSK